MTICPALPFPGFNGVWVDGPDSPTALDELESAVQEVEDAGVPCWVEVRAGATPAFEDAAQRLGFGLEETIPGMVVRRDELVSGLPATVEVTRVRDAAGVPWNDRLTARDARTSRPRLRPVHRPSASAPTSATAEPTPMARSNHDQRRSR